MLGTANAGGATAALGAASAALGAATAALGAATAGVSTAVELAPGAACADACARAFLAFSFSALSRSAFARAAARARASAVAGPTGAGAGFAAAAGGVTELETAEATTRGSTTRGSLESGFEGSPLAGSADADPVAGWAAPAESGTRRRRTMTVGCRRRTSACERVLLPGWVGAGERLAAVRGGAGERDSGVNERDPGFIVWATSFRCARERG
jgi:hypothetical protein